MKANACQMIFMPAKWNVCLPNERHACQTIFMLTKWNVCLPNESKRLSNGIYACQMECMLAKWKYRFDKSSISSKLK